MSEDLLSDNFADNINRAIVRRNFMITKLLLILGILWALLMLLDWYRFLNARDGGAIEGTYLIYNYIILPISDVIALSLNIYGYFLTVKAFRFFESSLDNSDGKLMSDGFRYFYTSNLLFAVTFTITIVMHLIGYFT